MNVSCCWEHNGDDTLLYAVNLPGAYTRGRNQNEALEKMTQEAASYLAWLGRTDTVEQITVCQEKASALEIRDADSDVLFTTEQAPLSQAEYAAQKRLALKSAADFLALYEAVPDKHKSVLLPRQSFYGDVPRTAQEMYEHTKNVNQYYFGEIGVAAGNEGDILTCRQRGFALLEQTPDYLSGRVFDGSYSEQWSLRKVLRRFVWHDRIHARAMWRMAERTFGAGCVQNIFGFSR